MTDLWHHYAATAPEPPGEWTAPGLVHPEYTSLSGEAYREAMSAFALARAVAWRLAYADAMTAAVEARAALEPTP